MNGYIYNMHVERKPCFEPLEFFKKKLNQLFVKYFKVFFGRRKIFEDKNILLFEVAENLCIEE